MSVSRALALLGCMLATLAPAVAGADDKQTCAAAHLEGQKLQRGGKLRAARTAFVTCGSDKCPDVVRKDCAKWLDEIATTLPTFVVEAKDATGNQTAEVRVEIDGELATERLTGIALTIDPGEHVLRFIGPGREIREQRFLFSEGEKNKRIAVDFTGPSRPAPISPPPEPARASFPTAAVVFGGIGLVAAGGATFFGVRALSEGNDLQGRCAPTCPRDDARGVRSQALVADVLIGVSALAFGAALYFVVARPSPKPPARAALIHF